MKSIYQLTVEAQELASILSEGEITEEIENVLIINQNELQTKAINYAYVIKSFEDDTQAINEEIKRLQGLKKNREGAIQRMKDAMIQAMDVYGLEKVESPTLKISLRNNPVSVQLVNEYQIPDQFKKEKVTVSIDKTAIKKAIESGEEVPGATLERSKGISIK